MGNVHEGGQHLACDVSLNEIPVFVRRGSIIPKSPVIQYADELNEQTLTIEVVPGEDDSFELYEDDGITYDCEKGQYAVIPLTWNEQSRSLTIGEREGTFEGMKEKRRFVVKVLDGKTETTKEVKYNGGAVTLRF